MSYKMCIRDSLVYFSPTRREDGWKSDTPAADGGTFGGCGC